MSQLMNLPINIPWRLLAASPDMLDTQFCDKQFPFAWRSSLAISAYRPKEADLPEELSDCDQGLTYLKITCSITGYQPSKDETERGYATFAGIPTEQQDKLDSIMKEYFACYGVLLNVAVFPHPNKIENLEDLPRIIDFEPKTRDIYQAATDTGEILSASSSSLKTDKSLTQTESSETGVALKGGYSAGGAEIAGELSHKWGETNSDAYSTQTDASRERRETQGTTTNLTQMYNLLTGYHPGTNRAVFLMLPRLHILQQTDPRTFVQGLRVIEGVQEFFLIVSHRKDLKGLCIDAFLETGHTSPNYQPPTPQAQYHESYEDFHVTAYAGPGKVHGDYRELQDTEKFPSSHHTVQGGWVIDRRPERAGSDPGHPGIHAGQISNTTAEQQQAKDSLVNYDYQAVDDYNVQVSGSIQGDASLLSVFGASTPGADFECDYHVLIRSEEPIGSTVVVGIPFFLTSRGLCACVDWIKDCPKVVSVKTPGDKKNPLDSIVHESKIKIDGSLLTKATISHSRMPAMKELLRNIHAEIVTSWRRPQRYAYGEVGFLSSDYFRDSVKSILPKETLSREISQIKELPREIVEVLGQEITVEKALKFDLSTLIRKTKLSARAVADARLIMLGIEPQAQPPKGDGREKQILK